MKQAAGPRCGCGTTDELALDSSSATRLFEFLQLIEEVSLALGQGRGRCDLCRSRFCGRITRLLACVVIVREGTDGTAIVLTKTINSSQEILQSL